MNINDLKAAFAAKAERPQAHAERRCISPPIGCGQSIEPGFRDALSVREYEISGWCQACQDRVFVEPDEEPEPSPYTLDDLPAYFLRDQTLAVVDFTPAAGTASTYGTSNHPRLGQPVSTANLITSLTQAQPLSGERQHRPLLDIDLRIGEPQVQPEGCFQVPVECASRNEDGFRARELLERSGNGGLLDLRWSASHVLLYWWAPVIVRETSPGKHHLYVDAVIPWTQYTAILAALEHIGLLETGYVNASMSRGYTALRVPWVRK